MIAAQVAATSLPTGVIAPIPVTTTRRFIYRSSRRRGAPSLGSRRSGSLRVAPDLRVQVADRVADRAELLRVFVGDVDVELLLELHDQLDDVEAVGAEVLDEAGLVGELLALHTELLLDDVADLLSVVGHGNESSLSNEVGNRRLNLVCLGGTLEIRGTVCPAAHMTIPPSTTNTCPVTYAAWSDARNATSPAISLGVPRRSSGICVKSVFLASSVIAAVMSVSM